LVAPPSVLEELPVEDMAEPEVHAKPASGRFCPMCKRVHAGERVELAA
jgi:hypothetical protein